MNVIKVVLLIALALVALGLIKLIALTLFGVAVGLLALAIKLAFVVGIVYLIWLGVRKLVHTV